MILESGIAMIWQCGKGYYEEALEALREFPPGRVHLKDFIVRMDQAYLAADLIIARAGAITVSELCHVGKPVILVPSPNVAEDHQTRNARALENRAAAICIADREALERLVPEALNLLNDRARMDSLSAGIAGLAVEDPAARIAREVAEMLHE
jgi:UDP-N-acetylglucosamine--N-acetylmuramyl-(pentapeptide) pyrophosphoryl-undecaprenol N-acetylglucosamine transferase